VDSPEAAAAAVRAIGLAAALLVAGRTLVRFWHREHKAGEQRGGHGPALGCIAIGAVLAFPFLGGAVLAGEWSGVLDPRMQRLSWNSPSGASAICCAVGLALLAVGDATPVPRAARNIAGLAAVVGSFALAGHTLEGPVLLRPALVAHVSIAAFWIGGVARLLSACRYETSTEVARAGTHFSRVAGWLVPLLPVLGILLATAHVKDWHSLATGYGALLMGKFGVFVMLMGLAAFNRWRGVPRTAAGDASACVRLRTILRVEAGLLFAVLALTATMTSGLVSHPGE
jgi:copper transport protein